MLIPVTLLCINVQYDYYRDVLETILLLFNRNKNKTSKSNSIDHCIGLIEKYHCIFSTGYEPKDDCLLINQLF